MSKITKEESNILAEFLALKGNEQIHNIFSKLGFKNVGSVVNFLQSENKINEEKIRTRMQELEGILANAEPSSTEAWMMRILLDEYRKFVLNG